MQIKTIDAHVCGTVVRLIVEGAPAPKGATMKEKETWFSRHGASRRRTVLREPRGHAAMIGALLTEPVSPGSHAGLLFLDADGSRAISIEGVMAAAAIALERGLLVPADPHGPLTFDTPSGTVHATIGSDAAGAAPAASTAVSCTGIPALALSGAVEVRWGTRHVNVDLAFAGELYAIVDSEAIGVPLDRQHLLELSRAGLAFAREVAAAPGVTAASGGAWDEVRATIFTGAPPEGADLRTVMVRANGVIERSPSGSGLAAVMAVLDAMGIVGDGASVTTEGLVGTRLTGSICQRMPLAERTAVVPQIQTTVWLIGESTWFGDERDPLSAGIVLV
jgi:proline racemase